MTDCSKCGEKVLAPHPNNPHVRHICPSRAELAAREAKEQGRDQFSAVLACFTVEQIADAIRVAAVSN